MGCRGDFQSFRCAYGNRSCTIFTDLDVAVSCRDGYAVSCGNDVAFYEYIACLKFGFTAVSCTTSGDLSEAVSGCYAAINGDVAFFGLYRCRFRAGYGFARTAGFFERDVTFFSQNADIATLDTISSYIRGFYAADNVNVTFRCSLNGRARLGRGFAVEGNVARVGDDFRRRAAGDGDSSTCYACFNEACAVGQDLSRQFGYDVPLEGNVAFACLSASCTEGEGADDGVGRFTVDDRSIAVACKGDVALGCDEGVAVRSLEGACEVDDAGRAGNVCALTLESIRPT